MGVKCGGCEVRAVMRVGRCEVWVGVNESVGVGYVGPHLAVLSGSHYVSAPPLPYAAPYVAATYTHHHMISYDFIS